MSKIETNHPATVTASVEPDRNMQSRRRLLAGVSLTAAASIPAMALGKMPAALMHEKASKIIDRTRNQGFPDSRVLAHSGERFRFYQDLVRDRVVLINFMSIRREPQLPITRNMASLVQAFGDRIGKDLHVFSISYDESDTPERLARFAGQFNVPAGWKFLSTTPEDVIALGYRLYRTAGRFRDTMHSDLIHYGNAAVGLWGTMSAEITDVDFAMQRVASIFPGPVQPGDSSRRAGPRRIDADGPSIHHRDRFGKA
ncbi:MAG: hypothetical protein RQ741_03645 [Wenzhouxiangellaceae bacterium]|nr:hypothetical protein [Wenzhouxiangellaceae bacterium]